MPIAYVLSRIVVGRILGLFFFLAIYPKLSFILHWYPWNNGIMPIGTACWVLLVKLRYTLPLYPLNIGIWLKTPKETVSLARWFRLRHIFRFWDPGDGIIREGMPTIFAYWARDSGVKILILVMAIGRVCDVFFPNLRKILPTLHWHISDGEFGNIFLTHSNYWIKLRIILDLKIRILAKLSRVVHC